MPTLKIFSYKGHVGCLMYMDGKFINDPSSPGQLGAVVDVTETSITQEAKEIINNVGREGGSFAQLMLTEHTDGAASVGVLGFGAVYLGKQADIKIGRDCDKSVLDKLKISEEEAPKDFRDFINAQMEVTN
jgi:hypothetical protein